MTIAPLKLNKKTICLHKARISPEFNEQAILVNSSWDYVDLWLKRGGHADAQFLWQQAKNFYDASRMLPSTSSPLTSYYCALNATKALLQVKSISHSFHHGLSGTKHNPNPKSFGDECTVIQKDGVFRGLCEYCEDTVSDKQSLSMKSLLYNLPLIHRAFTLTFRTSNQLFIPVKPPYFEKESKSQSVTLRAEVRGEEFSNGHTFKGLKTGFWQDTEAEGWVFRSKDSVNWSTKKEDKKRNLEVLVELHKSLRRHFVYIDGNKPLWYFRRLDKGDYVLDLSTLSIIFAVFHRLSELCRYKPHKIAAYSNGVQNWLLNEFVVNGLEQFIDEIAADITNREFLHPQRHSH